MHNACGPDDPPPACLPGEEPLVDLEVFEQAGQTLAATTPEGDERGRSEVGA